MHTPEPHTKATNMTGDSPSACLPHWGHSASLGTHSLTAPILVSPCCQHWFLCACMCMDAAHRAGWVECCQQGGMRVAGTIRALHSLMKHAATGERDKSGIGHPRAKVSQEDYGIRDLGANSGRWSVHRLQLQGERHMTTKRPTHCNPKTIQQRYWLKSQRQNIISIRIQC